MSEIMLLFLISGQLQILLWALAGTTAMHLREI